MKRSAIRHDLVGEDKYHPVRLHRLLPDDRDRGWSFRFRLRTSTCLAGILPNYETKKYHGAEVTMQDGTEKTGDSVIGRRALREMDRRTSPRRSIRYRFCDTTITIIITATTTTSTSTTITTASYTTRYCLCVYVCECVCVLSLPN